MHSETAGLITSAALPPWPSRCGISKLRSPHRNLLLDRVEKADELLMAMPLHVAADDGAVKDIEHCEQRGGAVTFESSNCFARFGNRPNESDH
jgi:hypothetical protein